MGNSRNRWTLLSTLALPCVVLSGLTPLHRRELLINRDLVNSTHFSPNSTHSANSTNAGNSTTGHLSPSASAAANFTLTPSANSTDGAISTDFSICDYTANFTSVMEVNLFIGATSIAQSNPLFGNLPIPKGTLRSDCVAAYTLQGLINTLETAYNNYTVVNDGYNKEFGYYIEYMQTLVPEILDDTLMFDTAKATSTEAMAPVGPGMQYFECKSTQSGSTSFPCDQAGQDSNVEEMGYHKTITTLKDKAGWEAELTKQGITSDWITFGDHTITHDETSGRGGRDWQYEFGGFPIAKSVMPIPNPKDIVTKALPHIPTLLIDMRATLIEIMLGGWSNGSTSDAATAYSTPVFMLMQAVENMAQVKKLGEKEEKELAEQREDIILLILSAVFMIVPYVGEEVAEAAGLATLARSVAIAGEAGNTALGIYNSVKDPSSAVVNILGSLLGIGGVTKAIRDGPGLAKVAKTVEDLTPSAINGFGSIFKSNSDMLADATKFCKWT